MAEQRGSQAQAVTANNPREALSGWRHHPRASRFLLTMVVLGLVAGAWLPKSWEAVRIARFIIGVFSAGMLASRDAAIWQRIDS